MLPSVLQVSGYSTQRLSLSSRLATLRLLLLFLLILLIFVLLIIRHGDRLHLSNLAEGLRHMGMLKMEIQETTNARS